MVSELQFTRDESRVCSLAKVYFAGQPLLAILSSMDRPYEDNQERQSYQKLDRKQIELLHLAVLN